MADAEGSPRARRTGLLQRIRRPNPGLIRTLLRRGRQPGDELRVLSRLRPPAGVLRREWHPDAGQHHIGSYARFRAADGAASGDGVYLDADFSALGEGGTDWAASGIAMTEVNPTHYAATVTAASRYAKTMMTVLLAMPCGSVAKLVMMATTDVR